MQICAINVLEQTDGVVLANSISCFKKKRLPKSMETVGPIDKLLLYLRSCLYVLCRINEVTLQQARLVLGWATVCGQVNHLSTKPASQVDSAFYPSWDGKMSISFRAE